MTLLFYDVKQQNFDDTLTLDKSHVLNGDWILSLMKNSESTFMANSASQALIYELKSFSKLKQFEINTGLDKLDWVAR